VLKLWFFTTVFTVLYMFQVIDKFVMITITIDCINVCLVYGLVLSLSIVISLSLWGQLSKNARSDPNSQKSFIVEQTHLTSKISQNKRSTLKLRCDECFTHAFTACGCVFREITLVGSNQGNYFENATACSKRTLKTTVATQLNWQ